MGVKAMFSKIYVGTQFTWFYLYSQINALIILMASE